MDYLGRAWMFKLEVEGGCHSRRGNSRTKERHCLGNKGKFIRTTISQWDLLSLEEPAAMHPKFKKEPEIET